jgi:hypothetical protein
MRKIVEGASRTVLPAYGVGAIIGLVMGMPVVFTGGIGAIVGLLVGATLRDDA